MLCFFVYIHTLLKDVCEDLQAGVGGEPSLDAQLFAQHSHQPGWKI